MTRHDAIDLQAYLRRIGRPGAVAPDMWTLPAIVAAHVTAIPFENFNPLLGLPVDLKLAALERKLVHEGCGGYCLDHNRLPEAALRAGMPAHAQRDRRLGDLADILPV